MKIKILAIALLAILSLPQTGYSQGASLTGDEVKALVTGKTLQFATTASGVTFVMKLESGGSGSGAGTGLRGTQNTSMKWRIGEKGELCTHRQDFGYDEVCTILRKADGGSFERINKDGQVQSSFTVR